jgi:hypothetical protein
VGDVGVVGVGASVGDIGVGNVIGGVSVSATDIGMHIGAKQHTSGGSTTTAMSTSMTLSRIEIQRQRLQQLTGCGSSGGAVIVSVSTTKIRSAAVTLPDK